MSADESGRKWPTLFLCLDLIPGPDAKIPAGDDIASLILNPDVNGPEWVRDWKVFTTRQGADAHAADSQNIIVMPLVLEGQYGN